MKKRVLIYIKCFVCEAHHSMSFLFALLSSMVAATTYASDIAVKNDDGVTICYNYCNGGKELTVAPSYSSDRYRGSVVIPESVVYMNRTRNVTGIEKEAFYNCIELTSITIPKTITSIVDNAFQGCGKLETVNITDLAAWCRITFAGPNMFYYQNHSDTGSNPLIFARCLVLNGEVIRDLVIPNGITTIKDDAFIGCHSFTSVTIPNTVTHIGNRAFRSCKYISNLKLSDGVGSIGDYAFSFCSSLEQIDMGKNIRYIGCAAFEQCRNIKKMTIPDIRNWCGIDFSTVDYTYVSYTANPIWENNNILIYSDKQTVIEDLIIPDGTPTISYGAFWGYKNLKSVIIPNSVTSIGRSTFQSCSLKTVSLGNSVERIGIEAFAGCPLTSIKIPASVVAIEDRAFACNLETVISEIETPFTISDDTFSQNTFFNATLYVPNGTIGKYKNTKGWKKFVFIEDGYSPSPVNTYQLTYTIDGIVYKTYTCESGTSITPETTPTKEGYTFSGWSEIPGTMPEKNVTVTGSFTINKYKLSYVVDGVEYKSYSIEYGANITPETAPSKEGYTFSGWSAEPSIMPAKNVTVTGSFVKNDEGSIFPGPVRINGIYYNLIPKGNAAEVTSNPNKYSGKVDIPKTVEYEGNSYTVTSIGNSAFHGCNGLTSVTIPNSVTSIGEGVFNKCDGLTSVHISDIAAWCNINFESNPLSYAHHLYLNGEEIKDLVIPNSVKTIEKGAFRDCTGLTSVSIPNSVTRIGHDAFFGCTGLTSVTIGNSVTSIGNHAFYNCSGLTSITIPNTVTSIGQGAFSCSGLTSVTIPSSVTSIGNFSFWYCIGLTSVTIPNSVTNIGSSAFSNCSGLTSVTIPNSVTSIGEYAFQGCWGLSSVTIPNSVTSIGGNAFQNCTGLTTITIPNSVKSIGDYAFMNCKELTDVYCYAEIVPSTNSSLFYNSYIEYATLHVPVASVNNYNTKEPWKNFKSIIKIEEPGDLNSDGELDVTDVVELIDMVLAGIYDPAGDINGDGEVDVTDVVELIDMVLAGE